MFKLTQLPKTFWPKGVALTFKNKLKKLMSFVPNTTPFIVWYSQRPNLNNLQVFLVSYPCTRA